VSAVSGHTNWDRKNLKGLCTLPHAGSRDAKAPASPGSAGTDKTVDDVDR